ncbi:MAG: cytidine deaminase [Verrucomicrobiota bacterium]|nr:cytidine deaminase [Verrucomicrobiota bacterium]
MNNPAVTDRQLIEAALSARGRAYAPYSRFGVGAAILSADGAIFTGCNIENISYGLTMCAERVAVGSAISQGANSFVAIAIVSDSAEPVVPCGACRQVLAEFRSDFRVLTATLSGESMEYRLDELLPKPRQGILG